MLTPYAATPDAERLCLTAGIKCHHGYYNKDEMGRFRIVLKKDLAQHANTGHHPPP
jgi:hypothetical protein